MKHIFAVCIGSLLLASCNLQGSVSKQKPTLPPVPTERKVTKADFTPEQRAAIEKKLRELQNTKPYIVEDAEQEDETVLVLNRKEEGQQFEQVPQELSILYLAQMQLAGSDFTLEKTLQENDVYTRYAISYRSNGLKISGILNVPLGDGPYPLIIANHGYIDPAIYTRGRGLKREQDHLARRGFAVLHPDYREHAQSDPSPNRTDVYDGMLEYSMDVINAIHAIKGSNLPSIDTNRIGMLGHSMGGGIASIVMSTFPDAVDAVVLYAPVSTDAWTNYDHWRHLRDDTDRTMQVLKSNVRNPNGWHLLSAKNYLYRAKAPVLIVHSKKDAEVPYEWSKQTAAKLKELGKKVELVLYENDGHEFIGKWEDFMERSVNFFEGNL